MFSNICSVSWSSLEVGSLYMTAQLSPIETMGLIYTGWRQRLAMTAVYHLFRYNGLKTISDARLCLYYVAGWLHQRHLERPYNDHAYIVH